MSTYSATALQKDVVPLNRFENGAIKLDGDLGDWQGMKTNSVFLQQGINSLMGHLHPDRDAALVKIAYDDNSFYVALKVADKSFVPAKNKKALAKGDVIELFLDIRPVTALKKDQQFRSEKYTKGVYQLRIAAPDKNNKIAVWSAGTSKGTPKGIEMAGKNTGDGYTLEVKIPFAGLFGKPTVQRFEKPIGFEVMLCDVDKKSEKGNANAWYYSINGLGYYRKLPQNFCVSSNVVTKGELVNLETHLLPLSKGLRVGKGFFTEQEKPDVNEFATFDCKFEHSDFDRKGETQKKKVEFIVGKTAVWKYPGLGIVFYEKNMDIKNLTPGRYYVSCHLAETGKSIRKFFYARTFGKNVMLFPVKKVGLSKKDVMEYTKKSATVPSGYPGWVFFPRKVELDNNFVFTNAKKLKGKFNSSMHPELLFYMSESFSKKKTNDIPVWGQIVITEPKSLKVVRKVKLKPLLLENMFELPVGGLKKGMYNVHFEFVTAEGKIYNPVMTYRQGTYSSKVDTKVILGVAEPFEQVIKTSMKDSNKLLSRAILLGNAGKTQFPKNNVADCFARSVWDMQLYKGRIYIGDGDWNRNRGPIDIWSFKPEPVDEKLDFKKEFTVDDESVDCFRVLDNKLFVPGIDSADKEITQWSLGNLYIKDDGKWRKFRTVPNGIHVLDVAVSNGNIYVATGTLKGGQVYKSADGAKTWQSLGDKFGKEGVNRFYQIAPVNDSLIAFSNDMYKVYLFGEGNSKKLKIPCMPFCKIKYSPINHLTNFKGLVYTVASSYKFGGTLTPNGLYWLSNLEHGARFIECFKDSIVVDIIARNNLCYVMTAEKKDDMYRALIFKSSNMKDWINVADIKNLPAFPNAFEFTDDSFYIGLASSYKEANKAAGNIYKLE